MDYDKLCMGCMQLKSDSLVCPYCGYDETTAVHDARCLPPRTILNGQYLVGKVLGQGGFGITYIAFELNLETKVAIKEYMPDGLVTRNLGENTVTAYSSSKLESFEYGMGKFLDEAKMMAKFNDVKSIVSVKNFFKENGTAYFVMDFIEGTNLAQYLLDKGGRIPPEEAILFITDIIDALAVVHKSGMLHRDISPDNIYLTKDGTIKLLDFGAARYAIGEQSKSLSIILKPGYAPEEQYRSKGIQGPWTDIYATAATLYHMITGQLPPDSMDRLNEDEIIPPSKLGISIPTHVENAILKALAVKAENRFQTMEEFKLALTGNIPEPPADLPSHATPLKNAQETVSIAKPASPQPVQQSVSIQKTDSPSRVQKLIIAFAAVLIVAAGILTGILLSNKGSKPVLGNDPNITKKPGVSDAPEPTNGLTVGTGGVSTQAPSNGPEQNAIITPEPTQGPNQTQAGQTKPRASMDPEKARADAENCLFIQNVIRKAIDDQDLVLPLMNSEEVTGELILRTRELPVVQGFELGFFEIKRDATEVRVVEGNRKTSDGYIRIGGNDVYYSREFEGYSRDNVKYDYKYIKTYDRRYQVTVPGDWDDVYIADLSVDFSAGVEDELKYTAGIVEYKYSNSMTLEEMFKSVEDTLNLYMDEDMEELQKINLSGYDGFRFEFTDVSENMELSYLCTVIETGEDIIQLFSWTLSDLYADYRDEFITIHDSFKVNQEYFE